MSEILSCADKTAYLGFFDYRRVKKEGGKKEGEKKEKAKKEVMKSGTLP